MIGRIAFISIFLVFISGCEKPDIDAFFDVPWPSDTRVIDGGNVLASGQVKNYEYPGAQSGFPLDMMQVAARHFLYTQGATKMEEQKFGVNGAVYFTLDQSLNESDLVDPKTTLEDTSPVQLVNVDVASNRYHERIPLELKYDEYATKQRPGTLLSLLPYSGFTLAFDSQYAAIIFNDLTTRDDQEPLQKKQLFLEIDQPWNDSMLITENQHALWQEHKLLVQEYVENIGRSMEEVVSFTVFSTQDPAKITLDLKDALHTLEDQDIIDMVLTEGPDVPALSEHQVCATAGGEYKWGELILRVKMPRWQKGIFPYMLFGGETSFSMRDGKIVIPYAYEVVNVAVSVPCDASNGPNPYIVSQSGNGATARSSAGLGERFLSRVSGDVSDVLIIGIGDLIAGNNRREDPGVVGALNLIRSTGLADDIADWIILPALRNGYFNAVAARGNMRQSAAETYIIKRIAENLVPIVEANISQQTLEDHGLSLASFEVDKNERVGLMGFSQGANNGFVNMAMDENYDFAYFGSGTGIDLHYIADAEGVSRLIGTVFPNLEYGELDYFHPIASFVQMGFDAMDSSNYVDYVNPTNLYISAGIYDDRVPAKSTEHVAMALARRGLINAAAGDQGDQLEAESFSYMLGLDPLIFPISGNTHAGQGTGVYSFGNHGHSPCGDTGGFLYTASRGGPAVLEEPCGVGF